MEPKDRERLEELANKMPEPGHPGLEKWWYAVVSQSPYIAAEETRILVHDMHVGMAIRALLEERDKLAKVAEAAQQVLKIHAPYVVDRTPDCGKFKEVVECTCFEWEEYSCVTVGVLYEALKEAGVMG